MTRNNGYASTRWVALAAAAVLAGCSGGSSGGGPAGTGTGDAAPTLIEMRYGRLVDIYSYRMVDRSKPDRRLSSNRVPVLVDRNVVVSPAIESDDLFDPVGEDNRNANFRFLPFDVATGHEELMILWDNDAPAERDRFQAALDVATASLVEVPASFRDQPLAVRPIPVVPRNAAIALRFDQPLPFTSDFFIGNPRALQLLRFRDDPNTVSPAQAFEPADYRVIVKGSTLVIDTTLIGPESRGRISTGLAPSGDNTTANYRLAIPTGGIVSRTFRVSQDAVPELNGIDSRGDAAVIRDFRSGNLSDGRVGALSDVEPPTIVADLAVGILDIDVQNRILTINKRFRQVAIRGRVPFVDGALDANTGLPGGAARVPGIDENGLPLPLPSGDFILQDVVSPSGETVTLRAEIIQNMDVGAVRRDPAFAAPGLDALGGDGGELRVARIRVASLTAFDSQGNQVAFEANTLPLGRDARLRVRYYEHVPYNPDVFASGKISDSVRRAEFMIIDPAPPQLDPDTGEPLDVGAFRTHVDPHAGIALRFSEPMDVDSVSTLDNYVLSTRDLTVRQFRLALENPKLATATMLASRLVDANGDGTLLRVTPPMGHFHNSGTGAPYWFHMDVGPDGVADLAGNVVDIFDKRTPALIDVDTSRGPVTGVEVPLQSFSVEYVIDEDAEDNLVGSRVFRFESTDEDGTPFSSVDFFGQFQLRDGRLFAAETTRRSIIADNTNLQSILRYDKGECIRNGDASVTPPLPQTHRPPGSFGGGLMFQCPSAVMTQNNPPAVFQPPAGAQPFGGVIEPHTARGARMMMAYREDDFSLSYRDANDFNIDIEQMHWAPWNDMTVLFDQFDRYTMALSHADKRPDLLFFLNGQSCNFDATSLNSGLSRTFLDNVLKGTQQTTVVRDQVYTINPADTFRAPDLVKFIPYPPFEDTYTWRDSRLVSWDMASDSAIGLGGSQDALSNFPTGDRTASIDSPWIPDDIMTSVGPIPSPLVPSPPPLGFPAIHVRDKGDFLGDLTRDHDPIALPLLVDISVYPDDTRALATAGNQFHIAHIGPCWASTPNPNGYYNAAFTAPLLRVWSAGGIDPTSFDITLVEPDKALIAQGGVIKDMGLGAPTTGLVQTQPGDSNLHWAQLDLVRKVSLVTAGFWDTQRPNTHKLGLFFRGLDSDLSIPRNGRPDFTAIPDLGVDDMMLMMDPPISEQTGGATVVVEMRGARRIDAELGPEQNGIFDPDPDNRNSALIDSRQHLYNPSYACEAYRYDQTHPFSVTLVDFPGDGVRVDADGLTPYLTEEHIDQMRDPILETLPRYMNFRLVMTNNIDSTPTVSPSLDSMAIVYRMKPNN